MVVEQYTLILKHELVDTEKQRTFRLDPPLCFSMAYDRSALYGAPFPIDIDRMMDRLKEELKKRLESMEVSE